MNNVSPGPLLLLILDGWGCRRDEQSAADNAIARADTPHWDALWSNCPHSLIETSGRAVGLPDGQMGNSEVGHMNIGAGRVIYQELTRIDQAIEDSSFEHNAVLLQAIQRAADQGGRVHVMGLLSPGGVHSHEDHLLATVALADRQAPVSVHAFLDGRDTPPKSAAASIDKLQNAVDDCRHARIATVSGRYFAMDRDRRWQRTEPAYRAIAEAQAEHHATDAAAALQAAYRRNETDEFVQPTVIDGGQPIADGDTVIFINFRADRARQLSRVFVDSEFDGFQRRQPQLGAFVCMTEYDAELQPAAIAFPKARHSQLLGQVLADHGLSQLRIAETEKYAHVTFFFNGGEETEFDGETRILIPSPEVATYDLQPEMSAPELSRRLAAAIRSGDHRVIICNVANPDMVGHTGNFEAAVQAVEAVDRLLGEVIEALDDSGGEMLLTADHGNVEQMRDADNDQAHTAHTLNPVPLVYRGRPASMRAGGSLQDIAPTLLHLLALDPPGEMTGQPLVALESDGNN